MGLVIQLSDSASNPHIALKFCETYNTITSKDFIIFGWSHLTDKVGFNNGTQSWVLWDYVTG